MRRRLDDWAERHLEHPERIVAWSALIAVLAYIVLPAFLGEGPFAL